MHLMWILTTFCLLPVAAAPQSEPAPEVRPALAVFERLLDRTVARAAPASPIAMLAGPGGSRGYHLRGQGAFFVLPPRRLPTHRPHVMMFRAGPGSVPLAGPGGRELAERMAALHEEAERMNREAERAYRRVRREIEVRYRDAPGETDPAPNEMSDPLPADDPNPFGWQAGPAPPWFFWFESDAPGAEAAAGADELVGEVRAALTAALESQQALMPMLGPDEFVAVAVDFVSDPFFLSGSERPRTLLLRVSRRDIEARRSGRLTAEEFRERIVYEEY